MEKIVELPEVERHYVDPASEWSMQLKKCEINPLKPNIMYGYFHSTKQGLRTKVQHIETGALNQELLDVKQGKIKGKPSPGNPKELRLTGMEEKYSNKFDIDKDEEVLIEPMFEFIIKLAEDRGAVS